MRVRKAKTIKNYLYSLTKFNQFLRARYPTQFEVSGMNAILANWRASLKTQESKETSVLRAKQKGNTFYTHLVKVNMSVIL